MFERFTSDARQVVVHAQAEARRLRHDRIGTEHLLLAMLAAGAQSRVVLARHGITHERADQAIAGYVGDEDLDADALTTLGIDLDAVRERVEAAFGPGALDRARPGGRRESSTHIPFTPRAKKVLELSLREAIALKQKTITDRHIALGLLRDGEGLAMKVLADHGVDLADLRRDLSTEA